jgi:hypothetical protein
LLLAQAADKLPPPTRAAAMMALLGIALLGMLLVVVILLGGHWVRRQGRFRRGPSVPPDRRPVVPLTSPSAPPEGDDGELNAGETIPNQTTRHGETKPR